MVIGTVKLVSALMSAAGALAYVQYRRDLKAIRAAKERGGTIVETLFGPVQYAEEGEGEPLFVIHGAGGGYDQGLLVGRDMADSYRLIAPSRFGYLGTPVPEDASPSAQAHAHAALLDFLKIPRAVVLGASAGAPSAIELALRHPERVCALILYVPRTYDPTRSMGVDDSLSSQAVLWLVEKAADFLFWLAIRVTRSSIVKFLGVPPEVEANASDQERARVSDIIQSVPPLSDRVAGISIDNATEITPWALERVQVPALIISARDDLFKTLPGARFTAEHIPNAELQILESGGHLMVGQSRKVKAWVTDFLTRVGAAKANDRPSRRVDSPSALAPS